MAKHTVDTQHILVGDRYVFFTSLSNEKNPSLRALGAHALNRLNAIDNQLMNKKNENTKEVNDKPTLIESYLNLINQLANTMSQNEINFVKTQLALIKQIENTTQYTNEDLIAIKDIINDFDKSNKVNYPKLIEALNRLLLAPDDRKKLLTEQINNISIIKHNYELLEKKKQEEITKQYLTKYEDYKKTYTKDLVQAITINGNELTFVNETTNEAFTNEILQALQRMSRDKTFLDKLTIQYANNDISTASLLPDIVAYVTKEILNNKDSLTKNNWNADTIIQGISQKVDDFFSHNSLEIFYNKTQKSIEEYAMRRQNQFKDLARYVQNLDEKARDQLINEYTQGDKNSKLFNAYQALIANFNSPQIMANFTRELGLAIQAQISKEVSIKLNKNNPTFSEIKEYLSNHKTEFYKERKLATNLETQLSILNVTHSGIAELIASKNVAERIANVLTSNVPGVKINLKDDVQFTIGFTPNETLTNEENEMVGKINEIITKHYQNFLPTYKELSTGTTEIKASHTALNQIFTNISNELKNIGMNENTLENLLNKLKNNIQGSISVKDYTLYNDALGFHGGSLGAGKVSDSVIENILQMYEMGGINQMDVDTLIFAVINSTDSTYGNDALKQHIANFLLGGAALLMFDEDFNNAKQFLDQGMNQLLAGHTTNVQLYQLNSFYIPASFILHTIYQQLLPIYNDIVTNVMAKPKTNYVNITTHNLSPEDIPTGSDYSEPITRWNDISSKAISQTKIEFMFMAGMLDIMENLSKAFKINV